VLDNIRPIPEQKWCSHYSNLFDFWINGFKFMWAAEMNCSVEVLYILRS